MAKLAFINFNPRANQAPHIIPLALQCSYNAQLECHLYTQDHAEVIADIAALYPEHHCNIHTLTPSKLDKIKQSLTNRPFGRSECFSQTKQCLQQADLVVTPDAILHRLLLKLPPHKRPLSALVEHGSGDRLPVLNNTFTYLYDIHLVPGQKYYDLKQMQMQHTSQQIVAMTGYIKFDYALRNPNEFTPAFPQKRPIVLYNPHFNQKDGASWYTWGNKILDYFYHSNNYNLIFAPHVNLFQRGSPAPAIAKPYLDCPHIHIDVNSKACVDMSYTKVADLYLGDRSSQVFEFLYKPRPVVFLNVQHRAWQNDSEYYSWQLGKVIEDLNQLDAALKQQLSLNAYEQAQRKAFEYTFSITEESASQRSARALIKLLEQRGLS